MEPDPADSGRRARRSSRPWPIRFISATTGIFVLSESLSIAARHAFDVHHGVWLVRPFLFILHDQNSDGLLGLGSTPSRIAIGVLAGGMVLLASRILLGFAPGDRRWLEIASGVFVGAALANAFEVITYASVTDLVVIRFQRTGGDFVRAFNLADICLGVGGLGSLIAYAAALRRRGGG